MIIISVISLSDKLGLEQIKQFSISVIRPLLDLNLPVSDSHDNDLALASSETAVLNNRTKAETTFNNIKIGNGPNFIAVNPVTRELYVVNQGNNTLSVINYTADDVLHNIKVGNMLASDVAVNKKTNMIYVGSSIANEEYVVRPGIVVINGTTHEVVQKVRTFGLSIPFKLEINEKTNMVYALGQGALSAINGSTNKAVKLVPGIGGFGKDIAVDPINNTIYLSLDSNVVSVIDPARNKNLSMNPNVVSVIDPARNKIVQNITVTRDPDATSNPITDKVYVSNDVGNRISVIDGKTNKVTATIMENFSRTGSGTDLAVDYKKDLVYMTVSGANLFYIIDAKTNQILGNLLVGKNPEDIDVDPLRGKIFVVSTGEDSVYVIDRDQMLGKEIGRKAGELASGVSGVKVGIQPMDLAVNSITNKIYVTDGVSNRVSVLDGDTDKILNTFAVHTPPSDIAINPNTDRIYLLNWEQKALLVIDGSTDAIIANASISGSYSGGRFPLNIAVDPSTNMIYITNGVPSSVDATPSRVVASPRTPANDSTPQPCISYDEGGIRMAGAGRDDNSTDSLCVIDGNTNEVIDSTSLTMPQDLAVDYNTHIVYAVDLENPSNPTIRTILGLAPENRYNLAEDANGFVPDITTASSPSRIDVSPDDNIIYVIGDKGKKLYKIDTYTNDVIGEFPVPGLASDVVVNPKTHVVYLTDEIGNVVYAIDMATETLLSTIPVGNSPSSIALNPLTNMIYVTNRNSGTVSIIDDNTNNLTTAVKFNVQPANTGIIICNPPIRVMNNYTRFAVGTELTCEARTRTQPTSTLMNLNEKIYSLFGAYSKWEFDSWTGIKPSSENPISFNVSKYGTELTANFKEAPPPPDYTSLIIIPAVFAAIPAIWAGLRRAQRRKYLDRYDKAIDMARNSVHVSKNESRQQLADLRKELSERLIRGKITEEQYNIFDKKISDYIQEIGE